MSRCLTSSLFVLSLLLAGCRDHEITAYRAPKEAPPAAPGAAAGMSMANAPELAPPSDLAGGLRWTAPSAWRDKGAAQMRRASYGVPGSAGEADLSLVVLPGAAGGVAENIKRWRGQVGLPAISDAEVLSETTALAVEEVTFTLCDLRDPSGKQGIRGAITVHEGDTVFVKLMGPLPTLTEAEGDFRAFLSSIRFH